MKALKEGTERSEDKQNNDVHLLKIDWEILQLWALYSFHIIFVSSGCEWFISFFPFYYYLKLIVLIVTVIPSTKIPNFLFEIVLVPMMHHIHVLLNLNWKETIKEQAVLIPWILLDIFILPGLISDEEAAVVKSIRDEQLREALKQNHAPPSPPVLDMDNIYIGGNDAPVAGGEDITGGADSYDDNRMKNATDQNVHVSVNSPDRATCMNTSMSKPQRPPISSSFTSPIARSRVAASSMHLKKFSRDHQLSSSSSSSIVTRSKSRLQKMRGSMEENLSVSVSGDSAIDNTPAPARSGRRRAVVKQNSGTAAIIKEKKGIEPSRSPRRPPMVAFKHTKGSLLAQTDKSPVKSRRSDRSVSSRSVQTCPIIDNFDDDMSFSSRRSVGNSVRKFITGDDNIRIRDFLFDLELPSIPSPQRMTNDGDESSVRTTRSQASVRNRSTRASEERRKYLEEWRKERKLKREKDRKHMNISKPIKKLDGQSQRSVLKQSTSRKTRPKPEDPKLSKGIPVQRKSRGAMKADKSKQGL